MFINLTNHPSSTWGMEQLKATLQYGQIIDLPFPIIEPHLGTDEVNTIADEMVKRIKETDTSPVVHIMGEMTFTYAVVSRLKALGITCLASTTERITVNTPDGKKLSEFKFVQFREY